MSNVNLLALLVYKMEQVEVHIFRCDKTNVGDWWSPPSQYFPMHASKTFDLIHSDQIPNQEGVYIVGGGGLGNAFFSPHLQRLSRPDRRY